MPSWSSRLHLGSPSASKSGPVPRSQGPRSPTDGRTPNGGIIQEPPLIGVPVLTGPGLPIRHGPPRAHHSRSLSHPFTSRAEDFDVDDDFNIRHDGLFVSEEPSSYNKQNEQASSMPGVLAHPGEKDLIAGKCATCGSLVRWPRHLDVFRCTVCLMVNDLKPRTSALVEASGQAGSAAEPNIEPTHKGTKRIIPLSLLSMC